MGSNTCSSREHADTLTNGNENLDQSVALVKALGWSGRGKMDCTVYKALKVWVH